MSTQHYPICMAEEYWADSYFSVARYYGGIQMNQHSYKIVNKEGITIFELSDPENEHYVGDGDEQVITPDLFDFIIIDYSDCHEDDGVAEDRVVLQCYR